MNIRIPVSERRRRRSRGHIIVESALTMLPTFAMIIFFADLGMMMFRWSTLQNAVREGARYAITFRREDDGSGTNTLLGQDASIKGVVERYAMGLVHADDSPNTIFVKYYSPTNVNTELTGATANQPGNVVEVSVQNVSFSWMMPLSGTFNGSAFFTGNDLEFKVYAADLLGAMPSGSLTVPR